MDFVIEIVEENANVFESRWKKFSDEKCAFLTLIV